MLALFFADTRLTVTWVLWVIAAVFLILAAVYRRAEALWACVLCMLIMELTKLLPLN